jgi:hypothetical protein
MFGSRYPQGWILVAFVVTGVLAASSWGEGQTRDAYPNFYETNLDEPAKAILGKNANEDVWRVSLPPLSDNSEGWHGAVSISIKPQVPEFRYSVTSHGERDGILVPLSKPSGDGVVAQAADDPNLPLDALIVIIESQEPPGRSTPYEFLVFGED